MEIAKPMTEDVDRKALLRQLGAPQASQNTALKAWVARDPSPVRLALAVQYFNSEYDEGLSPEEAFIPWIIETYDPDHSALLNLFNLSNIRQLRSHTSKETVLQGLGELWVSYWEELMIVETAWRAGKFRNNRLGIDETTRFLLDHEGMALGPDVFVDPESPLTFLRSFGSLDQSLPAPALAALDDNDYNEFRIALEDVGSFIGER